MTRAAAPRRTLVLAGLLLLTVCGAGAWLRFRRPPQPAAPAFDPLWQPAPQRERARNPTLTRGAAAGLEAVPYLQGYEAAPASRGVTVYERGRAQDGLNLVLSSHAPEADLVDMEGRVLHRWSRAFQDVWPQRRVGAHLGTRYWRRARAFPDGSLLAVFDSLGLVKLDRDSKVAWALECECHHDVHVAPDGTLYTLSRASRVYAPINATDATFEDFVEVLSPQGRPLRRVSLLKALVNSRYATLLDWIPRGGDVFHTNTVALLDGTLAARSPAFRAGNVLVSMFWLNTIAVVDLERESVEWALTGLWRHQHEPSLLPGGTMLLFDNAGRWGRSRVLEFDPLTQQVLWDYPGAEPDDLFSPTSGSSARLPNGNTLITESTAGRALEVTPARKIVWEFYNPRRSGAQGELIAALQEVTRLPLDYFGTSLAR